MDLTTAKATAGFLKEIVKPLIPNLLDKPTKEIGNGFANLFWLCFSPVLLAKNVLEPWVNKYYNQIDSEISKIPTDRLTEPPLNIIGPALEASKYHIEEENVRLMFAKLIASSMDTNQQPYTHPAFVENIKQMNSLDAKILEFLADHSEPDSVVGVIKIDLNIDYHNKYMKDIFSNLFPFEEINHLNCFQFSSSVDNLIRLRFIDIKYNSSYANKELYTPLLNHSLVDHFRSVHENENHSLVFSLGTWHITDYGKSFVRCCL